MMLNDERLEEFDPSELISLRRRIKRWFARHGRSLPWRETADPYRIWISEIMLQQTTVKAVVPYYERFLERFPEVHDLARASEEEVLQYWEGLGYYSRGRNLRKAAIAICNERNGRFPSSLAELQTLPGIGRYTAGAIRSFAFDLPAPIVEANTLRLYCRLLNYDGDPRSRDGEKLLWAFAGRLQPKKHASHINQALMELGSQVCTPAAPQCDLCPISMHCRSFHAGTQASVPRKKERIKITPVVEATVAIQRDGRYLVRQRQSSERWAGMWDFIRFPVEAIAFHRQLGPKTTALLHSEIETALAQSDGLAVTQLTFITEIRHSVTRYRIRLLCHLATFEDGITSDHQWRTLSELEALPMPISGRQFVHHLKDNGSESENH